MRIAGDGTAKGEGEGGPDLEAVDSACRQVAELGGAALQVKLGPQKRLCAGQELVENVVGALRSVYGHNSRALEEEGANGGAHLRNRRGQQDLSGQRGGGRGEEDKQGGDRRGQAGQPHSLTTRPWSSNPISTNLPKREELLFLEVLALPKASSRGFDSNTWEPHHYRCKQ